MEQASDGRSGGCGLSDGRSGESGDAWWEGWSRRGRGEERGGQNLFACACGGIVECSSRRLLAAIWWRLAGNVWEHEKGGNGLAATSRAPARCDKWSIIAVPLRNLLGTCARVKTRCPSLLRGQHLGGSGEHGEGCRPRRKCVVRERSTMRKGARCYQGAR
eukprot:363135-Chlamydomonas_euryale.AAC.4